MKSWKANRYPGWRPKGRPSTVRIAWAPIFTAHAATGVAILESLGSNLYSADSSYDAADRIRDETPGEPLR